LKNEQKHIVLLTPGFPLNEEDTTTITALQQFTKALSESSLNLEIKIISFQFPYTTKKYNWNGISVFPLNGKNKKYKKIIVWQKANRLLNKIHKKNKIDIIHSFWIGECAFVGEIFSKKHQIKHLITAMGQDVLKSNKYGYFFKNSNSKIITLSNRQHKLLKKNYNINSFIIPWGIKASEFPEIHKKTIDILGVGSLNKVKNYSLFVKIISKLNQHIKNLHVEIIGDGNLKEQLKKEILKNNLNNVIKLRDHLPRNKVLKKMSQANILLHTSHFESFGMVFIEALYAGMKIVSFEVGIAQNSLNWYVCKNSNDLLEYLIKTIQNENKSKRELLFTIQDSVLNYSKIYYE